MCESHLAINNQKHTLFLLLSMLQRQKNQLENYYQSLSHAKKTKNLKIKLFSFLNLKSFPSLDNTRTNKLLKMSENENCPCLEYKSVPNGEWSQCILESSSHHSSSSARSRFCGIGKRYRRLDCLNSNNHVVDIK